MPIESDVAWVVGTGIALLGIAGAAIARDRALVSLIRDGDDRVREEADKEAKALHERVNRVRDEYSKRSDLDAHVQQMNIALQGLASEVRTHTSETNKRLDNLVGVLVKNAKP